MLLTTAAIANNERCMHVYLVHDTASVVVLGKTFQRGNVYYYKYYVLGEQLQVFLSRRCP